MASRATVYSYAFFVMFFIVYQFITVILIAKNHSNKRAFCLPIYIEEVFISKTDSHDFFKNTLTILLKNDQNVFVIIFFISTNVFTIGVARIFD